MDNEKEIKMKKIEMEKLGRGALKVILDVIDLTLFSIIFIYVGLVLMKVEIGAFMLTYMVVTCIATFMIDAYNNKLSKKIINKKDW